MNAESLTHATAVQRDTYADWADRIATRAKRNIVAEKFRGYAQIARGADQGFYADTPTARRSA